MNRILGEPSKSQYSGTKKNSICNICGDNLNHLRALEQELHLSNCEIQEKLQ